MRTYTEQEIKAYFDWITETNPYAPIGLDAELMKKRMFDKTNGTYWTIDRVLDGHLKNKEAKQASLILCKIKGRFVSLHRINIEKY